MADRRAIGKQQARRQLLASLVRFLLLLPALSLALGRQSFDWIFMTVAAQLSGSVVRFLSRNAIVRGSVISNGAFAVDVQYGCDGRDVVILFAAAVLAFPSGWRAKLVGLGAGTILILLFNLVRIVTIFYIGVWAPQAFELAHYVVWQAAGILFVTGLFVVWLQRVAHVR